MQHNNKNNAIANELNSIIISLADIKAESISESLGIIETKVSHLEHLSQEMNIPELRALTHWMMLNTEVNDDNKDQISTLISDGSYHNWMNILSMLLQDYDQTLLPVIYKTLTEPKWIVKPSAPLLRNLASWIEKARLSSLEQENTTVEKELVTPEKNNEAEQIIDSNELIETSTLENLESIVSLESTPELEVQYTEELTDHQNHSMKQSPLSEIESTIDIANSDKHIFEEVKSTILEKNYSDIDTLNHFSDITTISKKEGLDTEKNINFYDEIEKETIINPIENIFSSDQKSTSIDVDSINNDTDKTLEHNNSNEIVEDSHTSKEVITEPEPTESSNDIFIIDENDDDFSMEVDDIIMSLATISAESDDLSENTEAYIAELQRFDMLAEISGYEKLVPISSWCQQNLSLFANSKSEKALQFVETGECWTWIELVKFAISDPDEISTISELNIELSREEWIEPLSVNDLQSLLLFLHNPQKSDDLDTPETIEVEELTSINTSDTAESESEEEKSQFSLKWEDDVHPELLEVYLEETNENIADISTYLKEIGSVEVTKEQRQDARRTAHTIKGGSAVVGITALSTYAYQLEKILDYAIDHSLDNESNELLHTASTGVQDLYNAIIEKKNSPKGFSETLSKLTLCAETLEALDDEPLELSAPVLPDFITQQNAKSNTTANDKIISNSLEEETIDLIIDSNLSSTPDDISANEELANNEENLHYYIDEITTTLDSVEIANSELDNDFNSTDNAASIAKEIDSTEDFITNETHIIEEDSNNEYSADNKETLGFIAENKRIEEIASIEEVESITIEKLDIQEDPIIARPLISIEDSINNNELSSDNNETDLHEENLNTESQSIDLSVEDDNTINNSEVKNDAIEPSIDETTYANGKDTSLPALIQSDDVSDFTAELDDIVMTLITTEVELEEKPFKLNAYTEELQRLDMLAEISGYPEIVTISNWYQNNLNLIADEATDELSEFISSGESWAWIELVSASLSDPSGDISHLSALSTELTRPEWIDDVSIEALQDLLLVLRGSTETSSETTEAFDEERVLDTEISSNINDIDLINNEASNTIQEKIITWDDDVHPELLSVYLQETSEQVTKIAELLHLISKGEADNEQQEHAARIAHTIKGASGVVGISEIVDFTHNLEDILDYAVNNDIPDETAELLAESSDCLESLFEAVQDKTAAPEEFEPLLSKLISYAEIIKNEASSNDKSSTTTLEMSDLPDFITSSQKSTFDKVETINIEDSGEDDNYIESINDDMLNNSVDTPILSEIVNISTDSSEEAIINKSINDELENTIESNLENIKEVTQEITSISAEKSDKASQNTTSQAPKAKSTPVTESHIRIPTTLINKLLNLAGELVTTSSQVSDKVEKTLETSTLIKAQDKRVHHMLDELSTTIYKQEKDQMTMLSSMQNKDFDTLEMDTYNELHSVAGLLTESILDSETIDNTLKTQLHEIHDNLRLLDNLNKELSETILNSRMESLNTLIPRLERIVRQTCRKTGKQAELVVTGNDINIDTEILSGLVDPLLHLLRNAIDHGIETPTDRESKNKKQAGKIQLNFSRQGNFIHMQLKDDGAGIDSEKIYQHAINKGLITPEQEFSKSEVLKLILEPGFSTQASVTDISGRGVGMDVVNKGIEALKGSLTINSELGEGSSFNVKIPLTLVTSSTLLVETAGNKVAIPTDTIEQLYYLSPEDVLDRDDNKFIRHDGKELAIESLAGILGWSAKGVDFTNAQTLLLIKGSQRLHAVYIDNIIHSREVVIKSLAHFIDGTKGVIGACHLSDGEVAPVMNLPQLLSLNEQKSYKIKHLDESDIEISNTDRTPQILVVDDSLSNRKALSLIIDKTEYDVVTAVDGLDALNVMNERHIDLVFTDLEMPRMTGLELTQAIRAWDEKKEIPIIMVTSRSTNKHRELAERAGVDDYLTKPVGTETLLEAIETWLKQTVEA